MPRFVARPDRSVADIALNALDRKNGAAKHLAKPGKDAEGKPDGGANGQDPNVIVATARGELWAYKQAEALSQTAQSVIKSQITQINDLQSFILSAVPYGLTTIDDVQNWVLYDGPDVPNTANMPDLGRRPNLYWYFGGDAHKIARVVTFQYTYRALTPSGVYVPVPDSIYVGFEDTYRRDANDRAVYNGAGIDQPPIARYDEAIPPSVPVAIAYGKQKLNESLDAELESLKINHFRAWQTGWVDYAGPARDATGVAPFNMTVAQLVDRPDEFNKLLYWHIAGKPERVAKAMRIQCFDDNLCLRSILIGFQGAGGFGPG